MSLQDNILNTVTEGQILHIACCEISEIVKWMKAQKIEDARECVCGIILQVP